VTSPRSALPALSDRLSLGDTPLRVSPFCLGRAAVPETVAAAYDAGINFFFFSADMHWPYYEATRRGLAALLGRSGGVRDDIVVAVVAYVTQLDFCHAPFLEALEAVPGLDRLDVLIAGGAYGGEIPARLRVYREHRARRHAGARATGVTFPDREAAASAIDEAAVDIAFVRYNPGHPGARTDLFPRLDARRRTRLFSFKSTSGYTPPERWRALGLGGSYWLPSITDHYRFALSRPELDGCLCAPATPDEVTALARALEEGPLSEDEEKHMMALAEVSR
jgi:hypothetical protein